MPGTLRYPSVLDQVIEYGGKGQIFLCALNQPVSKHCQQRGIERGIGGAKVQCQTPPLIVLNLFGRLSIRHAQDELQDQHAEQPHRIPRWTTIIHGVNARETLTVGLQQGEDRLGKEYVELRLATHGPRNPLGLSKQRH